MISPARARWIRPGAIAVAIAAIGVALALRPGKSHSRAKRPLLPSTVAARANPAVDSVRVDDFLANWRARLAAGSPISELTSALVDFGRRDPDKALDVAQWIARNAVERHTLVAAVVEDWAARDPAAAWRWAVATGTACDVPGAAPLPADVLMHVAARDPARVVTLLESLLQQEPRPGAINLGVVADQALGAIIDHAGTEVAWRALREWAAAPAAGSLGRDVYERVALRDAPADAAAKLAALPTSSGRNFALADVVAGWAARDPRPALAWAQGLPSDCRSDVAAAAFARWESNAPLAAAEWLASAAPGDDNDRLIAHLVADPRIVHSNVQAALSLAENVGDARLRCQCLESIVRRWAEADVGAATRYVTNDAKLTPDEKRDVLASLQSNEF